MRRPRGDRIARRPPERIRRRRRSEPRPVQKLTQLSRSHVGGQLPSEWEKKKLFFRLYNKRKGYIRRTITRSVREFLEQSCPYEHACTFKHTEQSVVVPRWVWHHPHPPPPPPSSTAVNGNHRVLFGTQLRAEMCSEQKL